MELITFEKEAYYKMMGEVMSMFKKALIEANKSVLEAKETDWIDTEEAKRLLNVKSKTKMQQLRDSGELVFSKYGRKIQYSKKSILNILIKNKVE